MPNHDNAWEPDVELVESVKDRGIYIDPKIKYLSPVQKLTLLQQAGVDLNDLAMTVFDLTVTEESTDFAIDWLVDVLPTFGFGPIVRRLLDSQLPGKLRGFLFRLLYGG